MLRLGQSLLYVRKIEWEPLQKEEHGTKANHNKLELGVV